MIAAVLAIYILSNYTLTYTIRKRDINILLTFYKVLRAQCTLY